MITSIVLENFKCFRKLEVNPRLITVFVGPNGSGKSSVLQALALLKQSAGQGNLIVKGALLKFPSDQKVKPNFQSDGGGLRLGFGGSYILAPPRIPALGEKVDFLYTAEFQGAQFVGHWGSISYSYSDRGRVRTLMLEARGGTATGPLVTSDPPTEYSLKGTVNIARLFEIGGVTRGTADRTTTDSLQSQVLMAPYRVLENLKFVPAARGLVQPVYGLGTHIVDDVSLSDGLSQQEQQTATNLAYSRPVEGKVSAWLRQITGVGLRADVVPAQSVEVTALAPTGDVNIVGEGFGSNALILLLHQLARATGGATVIIEEPESHLHPRAQAELASLLTDVAKAEKKQVVMTTHSEHIVGRLLTLVAEKKLTTDELALYAFEKDAKGVCTANQLEVIEDGRVKGDIKDFFEPELAELDRYIRALQAQK